jgi:hypothetical protein
MNNVIGIRLMYQLTDGSEHIEDGESLEEVRAKVTPKMTDWAIFELVQPGRFATRGCTLATSDDDDCPEHCPNRTAGEPCAMQHGWDYPGPAYPKS